ncbi:DJ-1/PfpI family protein [Massilia forsythiae]|uniref:DJ-1/PfpI family protein n=1 Tax=Massilia forsythiae TaxID=2728020 RepID=A0A7Z2VVW8_9BURK|nr:DJ-1/PfpI family protein [Massilia forsythiae]QJE00287.1 DJ-1/PfpI family protein [Massilia forsythiae]
MTATCHIGFLLFPQVTQLDLTGPAQVLSRVPGAQVHLVWKNREPVATDAGFSINPTTDFAACPPLDVLCVPGGFGIEFLLDDTETLDFLRRQGEQARYVTSVCTGSLVLGAAGLLRGYRSACHWMWRQYLPRFGAIPVAERIVRDRNRMSGGGVTAGIDFGLTLAAELGGEEVAKTLQLAFEYDPQPPFDCGSPEAAGVERVERLRGMQAERLRRVKQKMEACGYI